MRHCFDGMSETLLSVFDTQTLAFCLLSARDDVIFILFDPLSKQVPNLHRKFISIPSTKDGEVASCQKKEFDFTSTTEICFLKLVACTCLPRISHLSPSLHEAPHFLYANLSCHPTSPWHWESLLPLQWLMTGKGQHHLPWVSQWVTTNGHFFLWLVLVLKKLSELHIGVASWELHIGDQGHACPQPLEPEPVVTGPMDGLQDCLCAVYIAYRDNLN